MQASVRKFSTSTALVLILVGSAAAADFEEKFEGKKPAVSALNAKLDIGYIFTDFDTTPVVPGHFNAGAVIGSVSFPVTHSFGVQLDAGVAKFDATDVPIDFTVGGGAIHAFWRDPDVALLGFYGQYGRMSGGGLDFDLWRVGAEAEIYLDRISLEAFVGVDIIDSPVINDQYFSADVDIAYYFTDNFRVSAGLVHQFDETLGVLGTEVLLPFAGNSTSLYANAAFGNDETTVKAGLRFYLGKSGNSLMTRHREDDPRTMPLDYYGLGGILAPLIGIAPGPGPGGDGYGGDGYGGGGGGGDGYGYGAI